METLKPRESGPVMAPRKYPNALGERAQRLVVEARSTLTGEHVAAYVGT